MKKLLNRLSLLRAYVSLVKDPTKTEEVFKIADLGRAIRGPLVDETVQYVAKNPELQALLDKKYSVEVPPLEELSIYPDGTLGREFARHMLAHGLSIDFFPMPEGQGIEQYMIERGRKSHDFWHVLTGFGTDVPGEIGLQGFTLAQLRAPFSAILISGGILHTILKSPSQYGELVDQLFEGYQMGKNAKALIGQPIETMLKDNLNELRLKFNLTPYSAAHTA